MIFRTHTAGRFHNLSAINLSSNLFEFLSIEGFNTLAQVTYIQKFIMADSEDEFMPTFFAANAAFVAMSQNICRPGVGRPAISNIFDTAGRRRVGIGSTHDARSTPRFLELTRCPTTYHDDRPMQNRLTGRLSEFPPLAVMLAYDLNWRRYPSARRTATGVSAIYL